MRDCCTFYRFGRDQARQLFGCRTIEALRAFFQDVDPATPLLQAEHAALVLHQVLCDGSLEPDAGDYPLNHAVLGGRVLGHEPGYAVVLKRPDMSPHIAEGLAQVKPETVEAAFQQLHDANPERVAGTSSSDVALLLIELTKFFQAAASAGEAVVLVRQATQV